MPKAIMPPAITTHVATVRHKVSFCVKSHIASMHAITLAIMHKVITVKDKVFTLLGLINPRCLRFGIIGG